MQRHCSCVKFQPGKMLMSGYDIHELRELNPEHGFEVEELWASLVIKFPDLGGGEEDRGSSVRHFIA